MTAIAHTLFRTLHLAKESAKAINALKQITLLCGAGLLAALLALTYGVDLSPGFF